MSVICSTPDEFGKAIKSSEDEIIIEGDLVNKVIRIKAVGKGIWAVCIVALGAAVICYTTAPATAPLTGGMSLVGGTAATGLAATALGTAVGPAIAISAAAGGVGALNTLRDKYKIVERDKKRIKLKKKS